MAKTNTEIKEEIIALLRETKREGIEDVIEEMQTNGFFTAPASAGHHLNTEGGLAVHSLCTCKAALAVWEAMGKLEPTLENEVPRESVILASLLHDMCKVDIYKRTVKKRKTVTGAWEDSEGYSLTYKEFPLGHGEKSLVQVLLMGLEMTDAEMMAIRWHMGAWGVNMASVDERKNYDAALVKYPLVTIIHTADTLSARILERRSEDLDEL